MVRNSLKALIFVRFDIPFERTESLWKISLGVQINNFHGKQITGNFEV